MISFRRNYIDGIDLDNIHLQPADATCHTSSDLLRVSFPDRAISQRGDNKLDAEILWYIALRLLPPLGSRER